MKLFRYAIPLQILVSVTVSCCMLLLAGILIGWEFYNARANMMEATQVAMKYVADSVSMSVKSPIAPAQIVLKIISHDPIATAYTFEKRRPSLPVFAEALRNNPLCRAVYIGYDTGEIFLLRRTMEKGIKVIKNSPEEAYFILQSKKLLADGVYDEQMYFYDEGLELVAAHTLPAGYNVDPRQREWFKEGIQSTAVEFTKPYIFFTTRELGITLATRAKGAQAVMGIDITIGDISELLASLRITPNTEMVIIDEEKNVIGHLDTKRLHAASIGAESIVDLSALAVPAFDALVAGDSKEGVISSFSTSNPSTDWYGATYSLSGMGNSNLKLLVAVPAQELFSGIWASLYKQSLVALACVLVLMIIGAFSGRRIVQPLRDLTGQIAALENFDFSAPIGVRTMLTEVRDLGEVLSRMATAIRNFLQISVTLNKEQDLERMLYQVLEQMLDIVEMPQGAIYLYDDNESALKLSASKNGEYAPSIALPMGEAQDAELARHIRPYLQADEFITPLRNREGGLVGLLCIAWSQDVEHSQQESFAQFVDTISKSAAVAIETRQLILAQKALLAGMIKLIAGAVDAKSHYTGGHCQRVPDLALMLMEKAKADTGPDFAGYTMTKAQEDEFRIAAWLHDCGKLTTPEYIVDKATKLETLYNRIHEIRMRFEVLHRDATIACLEAIAAGADAVAAQKICREEQERLQEEFAFIARCNIGGEAMLESDIGRLQALAQRTWKRHFSNRLGLSHGELRQLGENGQAETLPVVEQLLADKKSHVISWGDRTPLVRADDPRNIWGFNMDLPQNMYNHGEVYNLSIRRGTLTEEDRFKVNEHIVQSICMLSSLPWPKSFRQVPRIAGRHHEKMDGTGYPCRLGSEQMTVSEKILAVADVFEALTAADRPYHEAKSLSQSLSIMAKMARDRHLDVSIFNLMLRSGLYREYAVKYMHTEQIDGIAVDELMALAGEKQRDQ